MLNWECQMEQKYWIHIIRELIKGNKEYLGWELNPLSYSNIYGPVYKLNYIKNNERIK